MKKIILILLIILVIPLVLKAELVPYIYDANCSYFYLSDPNGNIVLDPNDNPVIDPNSCWYAPIPNPFWEVSE